MKRLLSLFLFTLPLSSCASTEFLQSSGESREGAGRFLDEVRNWTVLFDEAAREGWDTEPDPSETRAPVPGDGGPGAEDLQRAEAELDAAEAAQSYDEMRDHLQRSLQHAETPRAYNNLGVLYQHGYGKRGTARDCYEDALRVDPSYTKARENLASLDQ